MRRPITPSAPESVSPVRVAILKTEIHESEKRERFQRYTMNNPAEADRERFRRDHVMKGRLKELVAA